MQVASHYLERRGATRLGPGLGIGLGRVHSDDDVGGSSTRMKTRNNGHVDVVISGQSGPPCHRSLCTGLCSVVYVVHARTCHSMHNALVGCECGSVLLLSFCLHCTCSGVRTAIGVCVCQQVEVRVRSVRHALPCPAKFDAASRGMPG